MFTGHNSQEDTPPSSLGKLDDTLTVEDSNINDAEDKSLTSTKSVEEHPPETTSNGKHSIEATSEGKQSPVSSEHSDSNVKSPIDEENLSSVPVTGISSTEVLDSARNRFEQFWGKPKYEVNGKESSM